MDARLPAPSDAVLADEASAQAGRGDTAADIGYAGAVSSRPTATPVS
ncbi:hypothetical protein [Agreia sp. COWG]|nr:hypothetical protein [Agreia sp. COWG]CAD5990905.1 protein of unknown function [Agreia sp. COWG]